MSLITITGYPASGKSSRARQLKAFLQEKAGGSKDVILLSEMSHSLDIKRSAYDNSAAEKPARGALLTAIIRLLSPNNILIVDAPNYIKGFRYQIYCAAREMKVRVATVSLLFTMAAVPRLSSFFDVVRFWVDMCICVCSSVHPNATIALDSQPIPTQSTFLLFRVPSKGRPLRPLHLCIQIIKLFSNTRNIRPRGCSNFPAVP